MLQPIDDATRRRLLAISALLCATSLFLAPVAGRSSIEPIEERDAAAARLEIPLLRPAPSEAPLPRVKDPFVSEYGSGPAQAAALVSGPDRSVVGLRVVQGQPTGIALPFSAVEVRAIVTGPAGARALVETDGRAHIVAEGDPLMGSSVKTIDSAGVHLANGTRLPVQEGRQ